MFRPSARAWALSAILTSSVFRVAAAESVTVTIDQARLIRLPAAISTLVIGNPLVADATLQKGGVAILTGKGYGTTNLLGLDNTGAVILEDTIIVGASKSSDMVTVYRGENRESYSCVPACEPRITLGDNKDYFDHAQAQSKSRTETAGAPAR